MKKTYKAYARNKVTNEYQVIEFQAQNKKAALKELRSNGYAVSDRKCKEKDVFDWIISSNYQDKLERNAYWCFNEIPVSEEQKQRLLSEYKVKANKNYYRKLALGM